MILKILLSTLFLFQINAQEIEEGCEHFYENVYQDVEKKLPFHLSKMCEGLPNIKTQAELKDVLKFYYDRLKKFEKANRHDTNSATVTCTPNKESKVLVIAFEGTGAFEPLIPPTISEFMKCFSGKLDPAIKNKVYNTVREIHKDSKGKDSKWSTLQSGIMSELTKKKDSKTVDWYSFPSEEVEQLAGVEELANTSIRQLYNDIKNSVDSNPKGIQNARACIKYYMAESAKLGINPKVVIVSHSSGGRSLVKFTEHVKKDLGIDIDLSFSIDPVKEAHHAVEEVVPQKAGEPFRYAKWKLSGGKGKDYPYSAVWSRDQPSVLYKSSNVKKHINFYQTEDRLGLKMGGDTMRFGINGSRMDKAENIHLTGFGADAHGPVGYHSKVLDRFNKEMEMLLK